MINKISSKESSLFKYAKKLISKSNFRKREKKFIVEGFREIQHCKNSNFTIDQIFVLEDKLQSLSIKDLKIDYTPVNKSAVDFFQQFIDEKII